MLSCASRPKLLYDASRSFQSAFEQLHLPWLCPAFCQRPTRRSTRTSTSVAEKRPTTIQSGPHQTIRKPTVIHNQSRGRGFAYAAVADYADIVEDYVPFDHIGLPYPQQTSSPYPWMPTGVRSELPSFNPSSPLVIHDSLRQTPRKFRDNGDGIGGELAEIHQTLEACLQVGRLERAAVTLRRLTTIYKLDASELIQAHNNYLASLIERVVQGKDQDLLRHVQHWFEVEIRSQGIPPDGTTYGLMLRAAFQEGNQGKIDRTIRRYIHLAEQAGRRDEALSTALNTLNEQQIGRVTRVCPMTFHSPSDIIVDDHFQVQPAEEFVEASTKEEFYQVRPQQQKGLGLMALKKSLSVFSGSSVVEHLGPEGRIDAVREKELAFRRQEDLERDTCTSALDRWRTEHEESLKRMGVHSGLQTKQIGAIMWSWHEVLVPLIREEIRKANEAEFKTKRLGTDHERGVYGPFLQYITPEKISAVTIIQCLNRMSIIGIERGVKITGLAMNIGRAIQDECAAEILKSRSSSRNAKGAFTQIRQKQLVQLVKRRYRETLIIPSRKNEDGASETSNSMQLSVDNDWPAAIKAQVGAVLISLLMQAAKLEVTRLDPSSGEISREVQPVFWNSYQYDRGRRYGVIRLNAAMSAKLTKEPVPGALSKHLPMLVEPVPWSKYNKGGFLQPGVPVVRGGTTNSQLREYIRVAADNGDMAQVFAGLDVLGKTPWRINQGVFNVMLEVWNSGEPLANIPAENPQFDYPPELDASADQEQRRKHAYLLREIEHAKDGVHSARCFLNFQLEVARAYVGETFYFPHNVDFRGRAYPIPPYLNHIGADNCRGLLLFGKGKELGEAGLRWLKIHLANVFGYDKASFQERQDFAKDHLPDIYDSANNPLKGSRWWLKAEDPWQCLATCMELKSALESPDPTKYISYLPVHQDGTCNGLQHYAALGGDAIGAKQVNLEPGDRPSDIYTAVAEFVQKEIGDDVANGNPIAKVLEGKVTRKVVKHPVMTNVYGVTFQGARRQVASQLRDLYPPEIIGDARNIFRLASYITTKIFKGLSSMFNGAHDIQYWLGECASRICVAVAPEQIRWIEANPMGSTTNSLFTSKPTNESKLKDEHTRFKSSVIWTTPLRMPVVQPYRSGTSKIVKTNLQMISLNEPSASDPVSKRKQIQGFPPNFIHSLDATHMLLSALKCNELDLSFAAVHDSFWTHAADLDAMNGVLRDAFISMHSEDIIGRLAAEFSARYKGYMYLAQVKANSALGKRIIALRASPKSDKKTFSQKQIDELILESRRLRLLASNDPAEQAEGEAIVTAGKLFAESDHPKELMTIEDIQGLESTIGKIPADESLDTEANPVFNTDFEDYERLQPVFGSGKAYASAVTTMTDVSDPDPADVGEEAEEAKSQKERAKKARNARTVWLWLPMAFPPVPNKVRETTPQIPKSISVTNSRVGQLRSVPAQGEHVFLFLSFASSIAALAYALRKSLPASGIASAFFFF